MNLIHSLIHFIAFSSPRGAWCLGRWVALIDFEGKNSSSPRSGTKGKCMICLEFHFWRAFASAGTAAASETPPRFHMQKWRIQSITFTRTRVSPCCTKGTTNTRLTLPAQTGTMGSVNKRLYNLQHCFQNIHFCKAWTFSSESLSHFDPLLAFFPLHSQHRRNAKHSLILSPRYFVHKAKDHSKSQEQKFPPKDSKDVQVYFIVAVLVHQWPALRLEQLTGLCAATSLGPSWKHSLKKAVEKGISWKM